MSRKYTQGRIALITQFAEVQIPAAIKNGTDYAGLREQMNIAVIEALTGSEYKQSKKGVAKFHFSKAMPHMEDVAQIAQIMDDYVSKVELSQAVANGAAEDDGDMSIPQVVSISKIPPFQGKITNKTLNEYLLSPTGVLNMVLDSAAVTQLAAFGDAARRDANIKTGIAVGVGAAAGATAAGIGYAVYKHNKNTAVADTDEDTLPEEDVPELPEPDVSDDDAPVVTIDEESETV